MGIRIDGNNDLINAADGTLTVEGLSVNVVGVSTASGGFKVGTAYTVFPNGNVATAGVVTAASGTFTNGVDASSSTVTANKVTLSDTIEHSGDSNTKIRFPSADTISFETAGSEALNINSDGDINVSTAATIKANGNATFSGIVTAASFSGDGSSLSGIDATTIKDSGGNVVVQGTIGGAVVTGVMTANVSGVYLGTHAVGLGTTTTTGRDAGIGTPVGSLVFNRTTNLVQIYKGNKWSDISDGTFSATGGTKSTSGGKVFHSIT